MKQPKIAIIGGGAAGIAAVIEICRTNQDVQTVIFEKNDKLLKKILATGNGRCNYSNEDLSPKHFYGDKDFLKSILTSQFSDDEIFFRELGMLTYSEDGRLYPKAQQASAVRNILLAGIRQKQVNIRTKCNVTSLKREKDFFCVNGEMFDTVIIAGGGKASPVHGSDGSCYALAKSLGHTITPLYPALCGLSTNDKSLASLKGVRAKGNATLLLNNTAVAEEYGEIQFTDKGISGIPVMNLSHLCKDCKDISFKIDFCNEICYEELYRHLVYSAQSKVDTETILNGIVNNKPAFLIMKKLDIKPHTLASSLTDNQIRAIAKLLKNFTVTCGGTKGFSTSQVTCGGINTNEIDAKTMMSKLHKDLFFCGEILDIHGDCGGYNLHLAWTTGRTAGTYAAKNSKG